MVSLRVLAAVLLVAGAAAARDMAVDPMPEQPEEPGMEMPAQPRGTTEMPDEMEMPGMKPGMDEMPETPEPPSQPITIGETPVYRAWLTAEEPTCGAESGAEPLIELQADGTCVEMPKEGEPLYEFFLMSNATTASTKKPGPLKAKYTHFKLHCNCDPINMRKMNIPEGFADYVKTMPDDDSHSGVAELFEAMQTTTYTACAALACTSDKCGKCDMLDFATGVLRERMGMPMGDVDRETYSPDVWVMGLGECGPWLQFSQQVTCE